MTEHKKEVELFTESQIEYLKYVGIRVEQTDQQHQAIFNDRADREHNKYEYLRKGIDNLIFNLDK